MNAGMHSVGWQRKLPASLVMVVGLFAGRAALLANPNPHFNELIAELQLRSAAHANSEDKVDLKKKKAVDKAIASFFKKPSVSLATDLKLAGKVIKSLAKAYPEEFLPQVTLAASPAGLVEQDLSDLIQAVLAAFGGDINALLAAAQDLLGSAPSGPCRDKAQAALDDVAAQLATYDSAPDLATGAKILGTAAKNVLKGQSLAAAAAQCGSDNGGGGLEWYQWLLGVTVNGTPLSVAVDARDPGLDSIYVTYFSSGWLTVNAHKAGSGADFFTIYFEVFVGSPGSTGSRAITGSGSYYDSTGVLGLTSGTFTITKWPKSFPERMIANFSFTAMESGGAMRTINATAGAVSVWLYPPF